MSCNDGSGFGVTYAAGGRLDAPFYPSKPKPYIKGFLLHAKGGMQQEEFVLPHDVEFLGIAVGASKYDTEDNWGMRINGEAVIETIFTKDLPEGMFFTVLIPLVAGDKITFNFNAASGTPKDVWYNYQFLKD